MKQKLLSLLRRPAVLLLLAVELLVFGQALAAALRPAVVYEFTADQWEPIAQNSAIARDEDGRVGVTVKTDGEDILQTPAMDLPAGHYKVTAEYHCVPAVWEGGEEKHSYLYFTDDWGGVTGEKPCLDARSQQDTVTLNVRDASSAVRLVAHNDGGIFTVGVVKIEQDMLYAGACAAGWLVVFTLADAFLLLVVPGSPLALRDAELGACLWALLGITVLTCAALLTNNGGLQGADWAFHLTRIEGIAQGLREGQFPVRIYSQAKNGYGYAPSLFYGELLLYFPAVLRLLGMSVQGAYHTFILAVQLLTAGIAFGSFRQMFHHNKIALVGSALYMMGNYHLYKIYWITAVGEYSAMAFLPLIPAALALLYGEEPPTKAQARTACIELTVAFGMLVQVHLLTLEMAALAVAVFCLLNLRRTFTKPVLLTWLKAVVLVVLLNLWFLVPFLTVMTSGDYNGMYITMGDNGGQIIKNRGLRLAELFGWQDDHNNLGPELMIGAAALVWCWLALRAKGRSARRELRLGLWAVGFGALACWMATNTFPWQAVGRLPVIGRFLVAIQFPGRYLSLATLCFVAASLCAISLLRRQGQAKALSVLLLSVSVFGVALFFKDHQPSVDKIYLGDGGQVKYAWARNSNMAWYLDDLYLPNDAHQTRDGFQSKVAVTAVEIASVEQADGVTTLNCSEVTGELQHAELPLLYYPGYTALDGQSTVFKTANGLVGVTVPAGYSGSIRVAFREPKRWLIADMISLLTALALAARAVYCACGKKRGLHKK